MDQPTLFEMPPVPSPDPPRHRNVTAESKAIAPTKPELARAAAEILRRERRPIKCAVLAVLAWKALGLSHDPRRDKDDKEHMAALRRSFEDLRQVSLRGSRARAGQRGTGNDHGLCYAGLMRVRPSFVCRVDWFDGKPDALLFNDDVHSMIPITPADREQAMADTVNRLKYTLNKYNRPDEERLVHGEKTKSAEFAVVRHFRERWPDLIRERSNAHDYTRPASDDFQIKRSRERGFWKVDVATRNGRDGRFGGFEKECRDGHAAFHVLADVDGGMHNVYIVGFVTHEQFVRGVDELETSPLTRLEVFMNCEAAGTSYEDLERWTRQTQDERNDFVPPPRRSFGRDL